MFILPYDSVYFGHYFFAVNCRCLAGLYLCDPSLYLDHPEISISSFRCR